MKSASQKRNQPSFLKLSARLLLAATVVAVILCTAIAYRLFFADLLLDSTIVTVPDLVGRVFDRDSLPSAELYRIVCIEEYDATPRGTVLKQIPAAGSERKAVAGRHYVTLTVYVSKGEKTAAVPSLVGSSAQEAKVCLRERGLNVKLAKIYSARPVGEIIAQEPAADTLLTVGETVTLRVSQGPSQRTVQVPAVTNLSETRAQSLLQAYGLKASIRYRETSGKEGIVLSQSPRAASSASRGRTIDLIVSRRPAETTAPPEAEAIPDESGEAPPEAEESTEKREETNGQASESASPEDLIDRILDKYLPELR